MQESIIRSVLKLGEAALYKMMDGRMDEWLRMKKKKKEKIMIVMIVETMMMIKGKVK